MTPTDMVQHFQREVCGENMDLQKYTGAESMLYPVKAFGFSFVGCRKTEPRKHYGQNIVP